MVKFGSFNICPPTSKTSKHDSDTLHYHADLCNVMDIIHVPGVLCKYQIITVMLVVIKYALVDNHRQKCEHVHV